MSWIPLWILVKAPIATDEQRLFIASYAFVAIVATDMLDGYLARLWNQASSFGKIFDPLADKLLVILTLVGLCMTNILTTPFGWVLLGAIFCHESYAMLIRLAYRKKQGKIIAAGNSGKIKMALQTTGIWLAFMPIAEVRMATWILLLASIPFAFKALMEYSRD